MTFSVVNSRALSGMDAPLVEVETHLANGLPQFNIVGLPDTEVKESRDRVRAAILQSGFAFPAQKITVNLAPADLPKESGRFDLPIAIGILAASGQVNPDDLARYEFAGELALSGSLPRCCSGGRDNAPPICPPRYSARLRMSAANAPSRILAAASAGAISGSRPSLFMVGLLYFLSIRQVLMPNKLYNAQLPIKAVASGMMPNQPHQPI